jgi:hypothetical protein
MSDANKMSQYHHFIPQFILRGFATARATAGNAPTAAIPLTAKQRKNKKQNEILTLIDTKSGTLSKQLVRRQYGMVDMYRDVRAANQHDLEEKFSRLEAEVAQILAQARKTFERKKAVLCLMRSEKDTLRKFLFLMKYRSRQFHQRFDAASIDEYSADDKITMSSYMREKGFCTPRDVWLANMHAFLDLEMEPLGNWRSKIVRVAYPDDAKLFILHTMQSYLAFCRPASPAEEFILTENAFGIFEGPAGEDINILTGEQLRGVWTEWHNFAPVSSRLLILLRSNFLPGGIREQGFKTKALYYQMLLNMHAYPDRAGSILQDLPVHKCDNSYSKTEGSTRMLTRDPGELMSTDSFTFQCFELSSAQVNLINTLFLEEGYSTAAITYKSPAAAIKAIRSFLESPRPALKIVGVHDCPRLSYLHALHSALHDLGGACQLVYNRRTIPKLPLYPLDFGGHMTRWVGSHVALEIRDNHPKLMDLYRALGGRSCHKSLANRIYMLTCG